MAKGRGHYFFWNITDCQDRQINNALFCDVAKETQPFTCKYSTVHNSCRSLKQDSHICPPNKLNKHRTRNRQHKNFVNILFATSCHNYKSTSWTACLLSHRAPKASMTFCNLSIFLATFLVAWTRSFWRTKRKINRWIDDKSMKIASCFIGRYPLIWFWSTS